MDIANLGQHAEQTAEFPGHGPVMDGAGVGQGGGHPGSLASTGTARDSAAAIEDLICFTPGTPILTQQGERPIETLKTGDMVVTRDNGLSPIRWVGRRTVRGKGALAPIAVNSREMNGERRPLVVSPRHRVLFTGYRAELLFGEPEVLVSAKDLVNGRNVRVHEQDLVSYIHIMFDQHEVIYAAGIATESFFAGDAAVSAISDAAREELFAVFPDLRSASNLHLETARPCLRPHEALLLTLEDGSSANRY